MLDPDDPKFMQDFMEFEKLILELDIKLAGIFCAAFSDCHCLESAFKLINILGSVLDRPKIRIEFTENYINLLKMLDEELRCCEKIFAFQIQHVQEKGHLFADRRFPNIISTLKWIKQLRNTNINPNIYANCITK